MLEECTNYARQLESGYCSKSQIIENLRSYVEEGDFGELRQLLFPKPALPSAPRATPAAATPTSVSTTTKQQTPSQGMLPEIRVEQALASYQKPGQYQDQVTPPEGGYSTGTVNPATLTVVDPMAQFNFIEPLALDESFPNNFDSGTIKSLDPHAVYSYVFTFQDFF